MLISFVFDSTKLFERLELLEPLEQFRFASSTTKSPFEVSRVQDRLTPR